MAVLVPLLPLHRKHDIVPRFSIHNVFSMKEEMDATNWGDILASTAKGALLCGRRNTHGAGAGSPRSPVHSLQLTCMQRRCCCCCRLGRA